MNINIDRKDLMLIAEALSVYQFAIEDDEENYYKYPFGIGQVEKLKDFIENELDLEEITFQEWQEDCKACGFEGYDSPVALAAFKAGQKFATRGKK